MEIKGQLIHLLITVFVMIVYILIPAGLFYIGYLLIRFLKNRGSNSEINKSISISDEIEKLHQQYLKGIITKEEFELLKSKLLL